MRGVTPGAEPDAGSDDNAESPPRDLDQAASSAAGPANTGAQNAGAQQQAGQAGAEASPDDPNGPAAGEASPGSAGKAGSGTAGRKPAVRRSRGARFLRELVM